MISVVNGRNSVVNEVEIAPFPPCINKPTGIKLNRNSKDRLPKIRIGAGKYICLPFNCFREHTLEKYEIKIIKVSI